MSPGYLSLKALEEKKLPFNQSERQEILNHLRKYPPSDYRGIRFNTVDLMYLVLKETCERLKIPLLKREKRKNVRFFVMSFEPFDYPEYIKYTFLNTGYLDKLIQKEQKITRCYVT